MGLAERTHCLNRAHITGKHKARVFDSVLGITADNASILAEALRLAARDSNAKIKSRSDDATKFAIESVVTGPRGPAVVRSEWILERGSAIPRLPTCFVKLPPRGSEQ
jgi:hypothetical protein